MSEYESSYYEIALTHRQVVVSFVVLLVFVAGVFLCGVWVGKNGADDVAPDRTRIAQGETPDLPSDLDGVEEYSFDGAADEGAGGEAGESAPNGRDESLDTPDLSVLENPTPQTTLAQDLGRDQDRDAGTREAPPPPSRPQASNPQTSNPAQPPPPQTAPPPKTSPPPVTAEDGPFRPTSATPAPSPVPAGESASGFVVQVFSGRDEDQAKKVEQTLISDGYKAFLSPVKVGSQMRYRVRIGPFDDRSDAEGVERIVRQKYRYETWVTSAEN